MLHLFECVLNPLLGMSITAAFVAVVVILLRAILKKRAPKQVVCLLWLAVFARLLIPVMVQSPISLVPTALEDIVQTGQTEESSQPVESPNPGTVDDTPVSSPAVPGTYIPGVSATPAPPVVTQPVAGTTQSPAVTPPVTEDPPVLEGPSEPEPPVTEAPTEEPPVVEEPAVPAWPVVLSAVWLAGVAVMLVVGIGSYVKLRRRVFDAIRTADGVWEHPSLTSPFILGLIRPKIYLPMGIEGQPRQFILHHERAHLRRLDHVVKPICWLALAIHWFNPLAWAAFLLMSRDIETACDESVIRKLGSGVKADYSATLLALATDKRFPAPSPLSFGEGDAKVRIKNVLNFKKPALWVTIAAVVVAVIAALCLLTDPVDGNREKWYPREIVFTRSQEFVEWDDLLEYEYYYWAYRTDGGERRLIAGWAASEDTKTFIGFYHPDGTEENVDNPTIPYEQHVIDAAREIDPDWERELGQHGGFELIGTAESADGTVTVTAFLTPEGNLLLCRDGSMQVVEVYRNYGWTVDSVELKDVTADGRDDFILTWNTDSGLASAAYRFSGADQWEPLWNPLDRDFPDLSGYTTMEKYPGLYFLEEPSSTVGTKITAYKLIDGELVLVGGYDEHMANNFYGLIGPDGEEKHLFLSPDEVYAMFEELLTAALDPDWTPGAAGETLPTDDPVDDPVDDPDIPDPELYFSVTPVEGSAANGLFTQFELTYEGRSVVFDCHAVENEMRSVGDCRSADLNGDGVQELIVSLVTAYGTGILEQELHIFDSRTLEEYPADGLAEQLAAQFTFAADDTAFYINAHNFAASIGKSELDFGYYIKLLDTIHIGEHYRYTVEDGKLYCVFSCCVAEGWTYYGELWVELGLSLVDSVVINGYQLRIPGKDTVTATLSEGTLLVTPTAPHESSRDFYGEFEMITDSGAITFIGSHAKGEDIGFFRQDLNGDGTKEYIVMLVPGWGSGPVKHELHIFDGATLEEYESAGDWKLLFSDMTQFTADEENYYITVGDFKTSVSKAAARYAFPNSELADNMDFNENHYLSVKNGVLTANYACNVGHWDAYGYLRAELCIENGTLAMRSICHDISMMELPPAELPPLGELFLSAITDELDIVDPGLGKTGTLSELLKATTPTVELRITRVSAVDLDGDGVKEFLLEMETAPDAPYGTMILHYSAADGKVYGYSLWMRAFMDVKTDGTFTYSGGASVNGIARISFTAEGYEQEKITYSDWTHPDQTVYFYVNKQPATEDEFLAAFAAWRETPGLTWTDYTPENARLLLGVRFPEESGPPTGLGFLASLPTEIDTSKVITDPEEYYLVAKLPESHVYLYARNHGQDSMLLWNGSLWWPLEGRVAHSVRLTLPTLYLMEENSNSTTVAAVCEVASGTGMSMKELAVYVLGENTVDASHYVAMQDYVYDWSAVTDAFNDSNTLVYDAGTNSLTLLWNGTACFTGTLTEDLARSQALEDGWTGKLLANGDVINFTHNGGNSFTVTVETAIEGRPLSIGIVGFDLTWNVEFTGDGFAASAPTIVVSSKENLYLKAAVPGEDVYLFRSVGAFGRNYLYADGQVTVIRDSANLGDRVGDFRYVDLDGDGEKEVALVGNLFAGGGYFASLHVIDKGPDGWEIHSLQTAYEDYQRAADFSEALFAVGDDPTRVTMSLCGFELPFIVNDEVAARDGRYYVAGYDLSIPIIWEGDGYCLYQPGMIYREDGELMWGYQSELTGVGFQIPCRLTYHADGTFTQAPLGLVQSPDTPDKTLAAATKDFYVINTLYYDYDLIMFGSPEGTLPGSGLSNIPVESPVELMNHVELDNYPGFVDAGIYGGVMAVDFNGVLYAHGTFADPAAPTRFVRLTENVAMVSCGQFETYVLKKDGSLWGFGWSFDSGTNLPARKTMTVGGQTWYKLMDGVLFVEAGGVGECHVILSDHTLWSWKATGEMVKLADNAAFYCAGRSIDRDGNLLDGKGGVLLTDVKCANYHYAIRNDGTLWALTIPDPDTLWGAGTSLDEPVLITDGVAEIASGEFESILLKTDGTLWKLAIDGTMTDITIALR